MQRSFLIINTSFFIDHIHPLHLPPSLQPVITLHNFTVKIKPVKGCTSHYLWAAIGFLFLSCSTSIKTLVLPPGIDNHFRSGEIKHPLFKNNNMESLGYRMVSDSLISADYRDTTLSFGIILPRSSFVMKMAENKMVFGTDSLQCRVQYQTLGLQTESSSSSLLSDIILKPDINNPNYDYERNKKSVTPYVRMLKGTMQFPPSANSVTFLFRHEKAKKDFDTAHISGYFKYGNDSFILKPFYKQDLSRGKNAKPMQILQGYCLYKGDSLYAFLQHAPLIKTVFKPSLKDVLYLNNSTPAADQLLVAAYFFLVSRVVLTDGEGPLY